MIATIATVIAAAAAGAGIIYGLVKARGDWFSGTSQLVALQKDTIDALTAKVGELERQLEQVRAHLCHLEAAYRASRLCARAEICPRYIAVPDFIEASQKESDQT